MRGISACCVTHYNQAYAIKNNKFDISDYKYECLECGMKFANNIALGTHISQNHFTSEEYYIKFHKKSEEEGHCKWCNKPTSFNSIQEGYNKFCYNTSCNVNYYNKYENRHELCGDAISKGLIESQNLPNQIGYWTKKGYSEEQAKALVSERQTTNTVEKIMKRDKFDKNQATEKRREITKKWLDSLPKQNYSNVSQELFWQIHETIKNDYKEIHFATILNGTKVSDGTNNEYRIKTDKTVRSLDFFVKDLNKVIEFNGYYWHGKKNKHYDETKDKQRLDELKNLGLSVLIVNELDYYENKSKIIEECINFINNGN
jgi:very-short-patch-repair endonuclease